MPRQYQRSGDPWTIPWEMYHTPVQYIALLGETVNRRDDLGARDPLPPSNPPFSKPLLETPLLETPLAEPSGSVLSVDEHVECPRCKPTTGFMRGSFRALDLSVGGGT